MTLSHPAVLAESVASAGALERALPLAYGLTKEVAFCSGAVERDLLKQVLLHLPRLDPDSLGGAAPLRAEIERLAARLITRQAPFERWARQLPLESLERDSLVFAPCRAEVARVIHERFHYIGSFREGRHLALFHSRAADIPLALATLSRMDIGNLTPFFPSAEARRQVLVLSRLFAFDWAPRNTVSYLLGQTYKFARARLPKVESLLTYLNPNLGFTGASYQASNWNTFLEVPARYAYLDGNYITFRAILELAPSARRSVRYSRVPLEPLKLLRYELRKSHQPQRALPQREALGDEALPPAGAWLG
jgi:hypothetical protein